MWLYGFKQFHLAVNPTRTNCESNRITPQRVNHDLVTQAT
jgi:hypothetical protein